MSLLLGVVAYSGLALALGIAIGRTIRDADRRQLHHRKACCPHPPEKAPATVRGEFRVVVVPLPEPRGRRLDVRA